MKIIITESQLNKLNEDITAGRMIVYHRTGKKGFNPSKNIADDGYIVSRGNHYGYGVYTTYDLESQIGNNMKNTYGPIIIESQILDTSKFLIFNYDIAKKIYKSRYRFIDQLKQILGKKEWLKYKDNDTIKDIDDTLEKGNIDYTSELARDFYLNLEDNFDENFKDSILQKLNGMIFTGGNDGNVLVSYNRRNIEPLRYSEDNGKTWTNIRNVKTYQRIKEPDDYRKNPEIQYLLNNIEVHQNLRSDFIEKIPSKYYDYILNYFSKKGNKLNHNESKIIRNIKLIKKFGDYDIFEILKKSKEKEQTAIELIEMKGDTLTSYDIKILLKLLKNNKSLIDIDVLIIKIINLIGKKLNYDIVETLLEYSTDKNIISTKIFEVIGKELGIEMRLILKYSTDKDLIVAKIIDLKGKELYSQDIRYLLEYSTDKEIIATKIIDLKGKKLNSHEIYMLLEYSTDKDFIATKIIDTIGEELSLQDVSYLLHFSTDKGPISIKIIEVKGKELNIMQISAFLLSSNDKELIKKSLLQNGVNYKLINDVITTNKIDIPLIPDNYQSMLNEIKRIKQIIR